MISKDTRGLHIDTNFFQEGEEAVHDSFSHNQRQESVENAKKSDASSIRKSGSRDTAIISMENTLKTLLLKQLFATWARFRNFTGIGVSQKSSAVHSPLNYQLNNDEEDYVRVDKNFQLYQYIRQQKRNNQRKQYEKSSSQNAGNAKFRSYQEQYQRPEVRYYPEQREYYQTQTDYQNDQANRDNRNEEVFRPQIKLNQEQQQGRIQQRLSNHANQLRAINMAMSNSYVSQRKRQHSFQQTPRESNRYGQSSRKTKKQYITIKNTTKRVHSEDSSSISESRAMILREIIDKLRNNKKKHENTHVSHSNKISFSVRNKLMKEMGRDERQFQSHIDRRINRLQNLMHNIKKEHLKADNKSALQTRRIRMTPDESYKANQLQQRHLNSQPHQTYQIGNQNSKDISEFYRIELDQLKRQIENVKIANKNYWKESRNMLKQTTPVQNITLPDHIARETFNFQANRLVDINSENQRQSSKGNLYLYSPAPVTLFEPIKQHQQLQERPSLIRLENPIRPPNSSSLSFIRPVSQPAYCYHEKNYNYSVEKRQEPSVGFFPQQFHVRSNAILKDSPQVYSTGQYMGRVQYRPFNNIQEAQRSSRDYSMDQRKRSPFPVYFGNSQKATIKNSVIQPLSTQVVSSMPLHQNRSQIAQSTVISSSYYIPQIPRTRGESNNVNECCGQKCRCCCHESVRKHYY